MKLMVLVGVLAIGGGTLGILGLAYLARENPHTFAPPDPRQGAPTREEFRARVLGRTLEEVVASEGKPNRSGLDSRTGKVRWVDYDERTWDALAGRLDGSVRVHFDPEGRAESVHY